VGDGEQAQLRVDEEESSCSPVNASGLAVGIPGGAPRPPLVAVKSGNGREAAGDATTSILKVAASPQTRWTDPGALIYMRAQPCEAQTYGRIDCVKTEKATILTACLTACLGELRLRKNSSRVEGPQNFTWNGSTVELGFCKMFGTTPDFTLSL
jgi:hypothetical protein